MGDSKAFFHHANIFSSMFFFLFTFSKFQKWGSILTNCLHCKWYLVFGGMLWAYFSSPVRKLVSPCTDVVYPWLLLLNSLIRSKCNEAEAVSYPWQRCTTAVVCIDVKWHQVGQQLPSSPKTKWTKLLKWCLNFLGLNSAVICTKSQQKCTRKQICNVWTKMVQYMLRF